MTDTTDTETDPDDATTPEDVLFPYDPADNWTTIDDLDGIDLTAGDGCPHCGGRRDHLTQGPAGWYSCHTCGAVWAGDVTNATLHDEPYQGPAVDAGGDADD